MVGWTTLETVCLNFLLLRISVVASGNTEKPFVAVWNSPTIRCQLGHKVEIPVSEYGITENTGGHWKGDQMVIFYESELGLYPYLTPDEVPINGGIPQSADIDGHFEKAAADIAYAIPDKDFSGYAVIDWEDWRPLFERNWSEKRRYQRWSLDLVQQKHPSWFAKDIEDQAKKEFDEAAKFLMEETLKLGKLMRPRGKWGFYGFPQCYNIGGLQANCSEVTMSLNDQLQWLYKASDVIYPTAYIRQTVGNASNYVYGQNTEALRVRKKFCSKDTPILLYTRYTIGDDIYYTEEHLANSLHQASVQGLDGVVFWGSSASSNKKEKCLQLQKYIRELFGPFVKGIMRKTHSCSLDVCNGNGRCVKKDSLRVDHLKHLWLHSIEKADEEHDQYFPNLLGLMLEAVFSITGSYKAIDSLNRIPIMGKGKANAKKDVEYLCSCFSGWTGEYCSYFEDPIERNSVLASNNIESLNDDLTKTCRKC